MYDIGNDKWRWKCLKFTSTKFHFTTVENREIINIDFTSNFHCKCQTTSNFHLGDSKLRFKCLTEESTLSKSFNSIAEKNDSFMNTTDQK